jgi:hypothetical protein
MADEESYIVRYRDLAKIVREQDATALEEFLDQPLQVIAETLTGALASKSQELAPIAGRLVQGALKGKLFEQVSREIIKLRDAGKINPNFAEEKTGYQSWVELMTIIDSELPDEDKLEALKAMFYSVNKVTASDSERIVAYQLFQIAKRLDSAALMVLKACWELNKGETGKQGNLAHSVWAVRVAEKLNYGLVGLVGLGEKSLVDNVLLTGRNMGNPDNVEGNNWRLTDLGIRFCQNIHEYQIEIASISDALSGTQK